MTDGPEPTVAPAVDRSLLAIGGGIVALVVVAVIAIVLLGSREAAPFPADTPEGIVQRHLAAVDDEDYEAARGYLSAAVRAEVSLEQYRRAAQDYGYETGGSRRVLFDRSEVDGDRARVWLTVEEYYDGGPFGGGNTYRSTREISLVREAGEWRIDQPIIGIEPMPFRDF